MQQHRDRGRDHPAGSRPPFFSLTNSLLLLNALVYLLQLYVRMQHPGFPLDYYLSLSLAGLRHGYLWQLLSFQFLHGGILHLLINSWGIYVFGPPVEQAVGRGRFGWLYLLSGLVGGLVHVSVSLILPLHFGTVTLGGAMADNPVVGASAGVFGLAAAFATLYPEAELRLLLPPVTVTARVLLLVSAGIGLLSVFFAGDRIAHGAHLGGMLTGFACVRWLAGCRKHN